MRRFALARLPLLAPLLLATSALASAPTPDAVPRQYMQGRLALSDNDFAVAAQKFGEALKAEPDDQLRRRAMDVAILQGDMKTAARLSGEIDVSESDDTLAAANSLVVLTKLAAAASRGDWRAWRAARPSFQEPMRSAEVTPVIGPLLDAYADVAAGQVDRALATIEPSTAKGAARSFFTEHRAHILAIAGRWPEAAQAYGDMIVAEDANLPRLRIAAAAAALEAGKKAPVWRDKAIAWLGGGSADDPLLGEARARLAANPSMGARQLGGVPQNAAQGLAQLFLRIAADLGRDRSGGPALAFARLSTMLDPAAPETWLVTAEILGRSDQYGLALEALDRVPPGGGWAAMAVGRRAAMLQQADRVPEARALLEARTHSPGAGVADWARLAELERGAKNWQAASAAYGKALALLPEQAVEARAQIHFLRGSALELGGQWKDAEGDLRTAVQLSPQNALYLNYLGYSLLDRGGDPAEARGYIAAAYKAQPENGAIIDSMGWAEYRAGNYREAVRLLEMARAAEPADPTVADHLGDALWRAGRRIEARHAWNSASALEPQADLAARLARKLDYGLDTLAQK